jgi:hypothetical protein
MITRSMLSSVFSLTPGKSAIHLKPCPPRRFEARPRLYSTRIMLALGGWLRARHGTTRPQRKPKKNSLPWLTGNSVQPRPTSQEETQTTRPVNPERSSEISSGGCLQEGCLICAAADVAAGVPGQGCLLARGRVAVLLLCAHAGHSGKLRQGVADGCEHRHPLVQVGDAQDSCYWWLGRDEAIAAPSGSGRRDR